ncbi:MAG: hypothetical protein L6R39_007244 [Caloplaca ligustica]|nr:MAG: hypothetical protein L6R39_007244 [Caloplaca ligustica]
MSSHNLRQRDLVKASSSQMIPTDVNTMDNIVAHVNRGVTANQIQQLVYDYVMSQATPESRLDAVMDSFAVAETGSETLGMIAVEAWALLEQEKVWKGRFRSAKEAKTMLETPQLAAIRRLFSQGGKRKDRAITNIQNRWPGLTQRQQLIELGEHYLDAISKVAEQYSYPEALDLLFKIRNRRLRRDGGGRSSSRDVTTKDWRDLVLLNSASEKEEILKIPALTPAERRKYDITDQESQMIIHSSRTVSQNARNQRRRFRNIVRKVVQKTELKGSQSADSHNEEYIAFDVETVRAIDDNEADQEENIEMEDTGVSEKENNKTEREDSIAEEDVAVAKEDVAVAEEDVAVAEEDVGIEEEDEIEEDEIEDDNMDEEDDDDADADPNFVDTESSKSVYKERE